MGRDINDEERKPDDAIDTREVSRTTGLAEITLAQWRSKAKGPPYFKVGRHIRYVRRDVLAWIDARKVGGK